MTCLTKILFCDTMNTSEWRPTQGQPKQAVNELESIFRRRLFSHQKGRPSPIVHCGAVVERCFFCWEGRCNYE